MPHFWHCTSTRSQNLYGAIIMRTAHYSFFVKELHLSAKSITWHLWHGNCPLAVQGHWAYSSAYGEGRIELRTNDIGSPRGSGAGVVMSMEPLWHGGIGIARIRCGDIDLEDCGCFFFTFESSMVPLFLDIFTAEVIGLGDAWTFGSAGLRCWLAGRGEGGLVRAGLPPEVLNIDNRLGRTAILSVSTFFGRITIFGRELIESNDIEGGCQVLGEMLRTLNPSWQPLGLPVGDDLATWCGE